jgi:hypothetical protein
MSRLRRWAAGAGAGFSQFRTEHLADEFETEFGLDGVSPYRGGMETALIDWRRQGRRAGD